MKLRYGQVAMKILRYGPIGKFGPRAVRPEGFVQNDEKIPLALHQRDSIGFANGNCYHVGLFLTEKPVVSDKSSNSHILPSCPVLVLISQSVIRGKRAPRVKDKTGIFRHGKFTGFLVISCMFCGSAL